MRKLALAAIAATLMSGAAIAHHDEIVWSTGDVVVSHAWTYENAEMAHAMRVYLTVENTGDAADRLVSASVPFAERVLFEGQAMDADGALEHRVFDAITVGPNQTITMQPGAVWIELDSVQATFEHGEHFDMTLTFENAGTIAIEVEVEAADDHEDGHDHEPSA